MAVARFMLVITVSVVVVAGCVVELGIGLEGAGHHLVAFK